MKGTKGSITAYLSLILVVMITLILTLIESARLSCARAVASAAAEEGIFSVFGDYDRILYEDYGLLFVDGGYDGTALKAGALMDIFSESADAVISSGTPGHDLFGIEIDGKALTGCLLATDQDYLPIRTQICRFMEMKLGADAISSLAEEFSWTGSVITDAENVGELDLDNIDDDLQRMAQEAAANRDPEEAEEPGEVVIPEDFVNPIDNINRLRRLGIMAFAIPFGKQLSGGSADLSRMAENRSLSSGFGMAAEQTSYPLERVMLAKYLTDMFPDFLDDTDMEGLQYQTEYAICGRSEDIDNLKSVINRILVVREVLNFLYLNACADKKAEAEGIAAIISLILTVPGGVEVITQILLLCWAYGESMVDVKTLLADGRVPLFKDDSTWQTSLGQLAGLSAASDVKKSSRGFGYREYLFMLLLLKDEDYLAAKAASLLEYDRRIKGNDPDFSIDTCVYAIETELSGTIGRHEFSLVRAGGYDS